jgi:hypothetical protein
LANQARRSSIPFGIAVARAADIDRARDRQDVVAIGKGVQLCLGPFPERGLERVLGRDHEIRPAFKIDAALLSHATIIVAASGLQKPAAAIAKAVARLRIAERLRLARIAKTVDALRDRLRLAGERLRLARGDCRGMTPNAEHLQQALGTVVHIFPFELEPTAFVQDLRKKMRQSIRRGDAVRDQQRVAILECRKVAWLRPRRHPTHHIDRARHATPPCVKLLPVNEANRRRPPQL